MPILDHDHTDYEDLLIDINTARDSARSRLVVDRPIRDPCGIGDGVVTDVTLGRRA